MLHCVFFLIYSYLPSGNIKKFNISLHKIGGTSAINGCSLTNKWYTTKREKQTHTYDYENILQYGIRNGVRAESATEHRQ